MQTLRFGWVQNLDAELELARTGPGYNPPARLLQNLELYAAGCRDLLGPEDWLVQPGTPHAEGLLGRAWCPTPLALAKLRAAGVEPEPHPPAAVLRRVNHRRFAFELGGGLPDQSYVEDRAELEARLRNSHDPWLLKRPLAFAGRGQLRILGTIQEKQWSWIDASLRRDGLILEPLVEPILELCLHGFAARNGRQELGTPCVQEVSSRGVFRRARPALPGELTPQELRSLFAQGERVASALLHAGYFGPFGIDAYRYRAGDRHGFCALSEINARYTMGFVTGFPRHPSQISIE